MSTFNGFSGLVSGIRSCMKASRSPAYRGQRKKRRFFTYAHALFDIFLVLICLFVFVMLDFPRGSVAILIVLCILLIVGAQSLWSNWSRR